LDDTYGALPDNVLLVVAGQHGLNWNNWERYSGVVVRLSLEPLTEATTRAYLSRRGILDGTVVDDILRRSGRLPLYVAIEAEYAGAPRRARPGEGAIVDRFLGRVDAPMRRQVALDLALPRRFNRDILGVLAEDREDDTIFSWLVEMPFVEEHADGWAYHRVARGPLLRRERGISPQRWADLHSRLATYHAEQQTNRPGDDETRWRDAAWQGHALEAVYHRLCQRPTAYLGAALDGFLAAWDAEYALARRWSETIREAGEDSDDAETSHWGTNLVALINAFDDERYAEAADSLGVLARYGGIEDRRRATALQRRGALLILLGRYASAVDDLTESLRLGADTLDTRQIRSFASWLQGHYDDALADLDHVLAREPDLAFARLLQCLAHLGSGRYADALVDLDQAITSVSEDADHIATMRSSCPP